MNKITKKLNYYMSLPYKVEVTPILEEDGGGFSATIPQFGYALVGDGETPEEALKDLKVTQRNLFWHYIEEEIEIPKPREE